MLFTMSMMLGIGYSPMGELDGEDALVEATVTVGVGEGIPCGEDVGGRKRGVADRISPPTTWGGINRVGGKY